MTHRKHLRLVGLLGAATLAAAAFGTGAAAQSPSTEVGGTQQFTIGFSNPHLEGRLIDRGA